MALKLDCQLLRKFALFAFIESHDEKCFLFHLESFFTSQDTSVLSSLFCNVEETT